MAPITLFKYCLNDSIAAKVIVDLDKVVLKFDSFRCIYHDVEQNLQPLTLNLTPGHWCSFRGGLKRCRRLHCYAAIICSFMLLLQPLHEEGLAVRPLWHGGEKVLPGLAWQLEQLLILSSALLELRVWWVN